MSKGSREECIIQMSALLLSAALLPTWETLVTCWWLLFGNLTRVSSLAKERGMVLFVSDAMEPFNSIDTCTECHRTE